MKKLRVAFLGSIISMVLILSGCEKSPEVYGKKISQIDRTSIIDINKEVNADELYAIYYMKSISKSSIQDKTLGEIINKFEKDTGTKVIKGKIISFKNYKVRDLNIESAAKQINQQATKEEITKIRKFVENIVKNGTPEEKEKMLDKTLGEIIK